MSPQPAPQPHDRADFALDGRVAAVTGGGRGIGRAIAEGLSAQGARLLLAGRNAASLEATAAAIREAGGEVIVKSADVALESEVAALASFAEENFGRIDILINNAGINPHYTAAPEVALAEWRAILDVNLTGVFLCCREFGKRMLAAGSGSIVNLSSIAAHVGLVRTTAYCAAKGGVEAMTRSLALEWAGRGVRVNALAPGYIETDLTAGLRAHSALSAGIAARTPMQRFGKPSELVGAAVFLASPAASYVTGQTLLVDGGWTAA